MDTPVNLTWTNKSDYFKNLEKEDQERYLNKLTLNSGILLPDPCSIKDSEWSSHQKDLPDLSFPDVTFYLVETASEFTKDKIRAYKSLEAFEFFVSGHVQDVFVYKLKRTDFLFLKSNVLPSQRQGQAATTYKVWVALHKTGWILSANCTCKAGYVKNFFCN